MFLLFVSAGFGQTTRSAELDKAVGVLRKIVWADWTDEQKEAKGKEIDEAWKVLLAAEQKGLARLKQEIAAVDAAKEKDDFFKLNATVLLWQIGKTAEAEYIAKVWESADISSQYTYVFLTAFEAAQTQDPKVLPMLRVILRDDKGVMYVPLHAMRVAWPLSHEFIWGAYGLKGLPVLEEILETSTNEIELASAIHLLVRSQWLPSLPRIRQLTTHPSSKVRHNAVRALGYYGHPDDFDRLVAGLGSTDPDEAFEYAFALYEFEDERAVAHLLPLLQNKSEKLQVEVALALLNLLTPDALVAVEAFAGKITNPEVKEFVSDRVDRISQKLPAGFRSMTRNQQAVALEKIKNAGITMSGTGKRLTNDEVELALKTWTEKGRVYRSGVDWPGTATLFASAGTHQLDQMIKAKASFYGRLSDECLYEVRDLEEVIRYVGRSRYRRNVGITAKAEPR